MKNMKLFFRYFKKYLAVLFIIILSNVYLVSYSNNLSKKEAEKDYVLKLQSGLNGLSMQIGKMRTVSDLLACNDAIHLLKRGNDPLPQDSYLLMNSAKQLLNQVNLFFDFPDYLFLLYENNDVFISSDQSSDNFTTFYDSFFTFDTLSAKELRAKIFSLDAPFDFLSCKNLTYHKYHQKNLNHPMVLVFHPHSANELENGIIDQSIALTYVIDTEKILELLSLNTYRDSLFLTLSYQGKEVYTYENNDSTQEETPSLHFEVTDSTGAYVLTASFTDTTKKTQFSYLSSTVWMYFILGLITSAMAAFFLSYKQYHRFHSLLQSVATKTGKTDFTYIDEFDFINKSVDKISEDCDSYRMQINLLKTQRRNSILENALLYGIYTAESKQFITEIFGETNTEFYYIAIFKIIASDSEAHARIFLAAKTYIENYYNHKNTVYSTLYAGDQIIFVISLNPNDSSALNGTEQIFYTMGNQLLKSEQFSYQAGISSIGHGIEHMHTCFLQASKVLCTIKDEYKNTVALYQSIKADVIASLISLDELQKLNDLILCNELDAITSFFKHIRNKYERNSSIYKSQAAEIFYSVKTVITNCIKQLEVDPSTISIPDYYPKQDFLHQLHALEVLTETICHIQKGNKELKKQETKDTILNYIKKHYMESGLTLAQVSQTLGISENYCYQFIKEQTGATFAVFLEQTRIKQAESFLSQTTKSNVEIAELVGFGSVKTFYRVYKKHKGITPGNYRELHQTEQTK